MVDRDLNHVLNESIRNPDNISNILNVSNNDVNNIEINPIHNDEIPSYLNYRSREGKQFPFTLNSLPYAINKKRTVMVIDNELVISENGKTVKTGQDAADYVFDKERPRVVEDNDEFTYSKTQGLYRIYRYHKLHKEGKDAQILYNELISRK